MNSMVKVNEQSVMLVRGDEFDHCRLQWWRDVSQARDRYTLQLSYRHGLVSGDGPDMFEALVQVRRQIEANGWLIAVQGARRDTYPSGMARDMGGGEKVYILRSGEQTRLEDLVDTIASADPSIIATVDQQEEYWESWRSESRGQY